MPGLCWGSPPAVQTGVLDTRRVDWSTCDESRREMRTGWRPCLPDTFVPICNRPCPHNEVTALAMRSMGPVPPEVFGPTGARAVLVWRELRKFTRRYRQGAWSWRETAESYSGLLKRRYLEAARSLEVDGLSGYQDWTIRAFLKTEKNRDPAKAMKPRLIFPRSPRYNLEVASRLKPFEHWLWGRLKGSVLGAATNTRLVAKGLNPRQRANLIKRKFGAFDSCCCFEVDGKAFEAHLGPSALMEEQRVYGTAFPGDRRLRFLLTKQLELKGSVSCGAKFSRPGCRASGDFNTGMGNTLCFLVEVVAAMRRFGVPYDVLADGDNVLIFLRGQDIQVVYPHFANIVKKSSGHEVTLERPASRLEDVRFGGSAPIDLGGVNGWTMVREYNRVLSGVFSSHIYLREPKFAREWMYGAVSCELSLARGVPVLQSFCLSAMAKLGRPRKLRSFPYAESFALGAWLATEDASLAVTQAARLSFEKAFGLAPEEQVAMERYFESIDFSGEWQHHPWVRKLGDWLDVPGVHDSWRF